MTQELSAFWQWALTALLSGGLAVAFFRWFINYKPDDDTDNSPLTLPARRLLMLYLISIDLIVIAAIATLFNFNFPAQTDPPNLGYTDTFWGVRYYLFQNTQLVLLGIFSGALGSLIHGVKSLADFLGNRTAKTSWFWFYITRPFLGAALALIFYAVLRGGFMTGTTSDAASVSPYGVVAICGLVGMFSDRAAMKLGHIFDTLFSGEDSRSGKMTAVEPGSLDPPTIRLNAAERDVTIRGVALGGTKRVRVNGTDRAPKSVGDTAIVFTLTDTEVSTRQHIKVQIVGSGDTPSTALTLFVSDLAVSTTSLSDAEVGTPYHPDPLAATGGTGAGTYKWSATGLPEGLTLDSATAQLSGTPGQETAKTWPVILTVTDGDGATDSAPLNLTVARAG